MSMFDQILAHGLPLYVGLRSSPAGRLSAAKPTASELVENVSCVCLILSTARRPPVPLQ